MCNTVCWYVYYVSSFQEISGCYGNDCRYPAKLAVAMNQTHVLWLEVWPLQLQLQPPDNRALIAKTYGLKRTICTQVLINAISICTLSKNGSCVNNVKTVEHFIPSKNQAAIINEGGLS